MFGLATKHAYMPFIGAETRDHSSLLPNPTKQIRRTPCDKKNRIFTPLSYSHNTSKQQIHVKFPQQATYVVSTSVAGISL